MVTSNKEPLTTRAHTCEAIKTHAQHITTKKHGKNGKTSATLRDTIDLVLNELRTTTSPQLDWIDPPEEVIFKKIQESTGSGSPDGWHGQEIRHLPKGVANLFGRIAARWRKTKTAPKAMTIARQVNLVKDSKIQPTTNTIEAADLRPISVISLRWRIYTIAWVTSDALAEWKKHYIPPCRGYLRRSVYGKLCSQSL